MVAVATENGFRTSGLTMEKLSCFKAYDVRGRVPEELNEELAYRIGRAYAAFLSPARVAVGRDIRHSSLPLSEALTAGLNAGGAEVWDLGLCGTEQVYFSTSHLCLDGGIMVTASHNPPEYNGMKFVREQSRPISGDSGLNEIERLATARELPPSPGPQGGRQPRTPLTAYISHLLGYIDPQGLTPLKVVVNAGNGCAGPVLDALEPHLPFRFMKICHEPDPDFPHGVPNPLLPENRRITADAVRQHGAAVGLAWDGDFDRCFFFDEQGTFIEGILPGGVYRPGAAGAASGRGNHSRPPVDLEHHRNGGSGRRPASDVQDRPRLYQGPDAGRKRPLWRGDVGPPLFP